MKLSTFSLCTHTQLGVESMPLLIEYLTAKVIQVTILYSNLATLLSSLCYVESFNKMNPNIICECEEVPMTVMEHAYKIMKEVTGRIFFL